LGYFNAKILGIPPLTQMHILQDSISWVRRSRLFVIVCFSSRRMASWGMAVCWVMPMGWSLAQADRRRVANGRGLASHWAHWSGGALEDH